MRWVCDGGLVPATAVGRLGCAVKGVMVQHGDHEHPGARPAPARMVEPGQRGGGRQDTLLPFIAAERVLRAEVLTGSV